MASTLNADNGVVSGSAGLKSSADSTGVLALQTNGTTAVTISATQQVGIGTTSPSAPLAIGRVNSAEEGGQLDLCRASDNASSWGIDVFGSTSTPSLRFIDNVASATRMLIDGSGNVGIGSAPSATSGRSLDINGVSLQPLILLRANSATSATSEWTLDTVNSLVSFTSNAWATRWQVNGAERMRIDTSGNVGIGITNPSAYGRLAFSGNLGTTGTQFNMYPGADYEFVQRNSYKMNFYVNGASVLASLSITGVWTNASDARYKENIVDSQYGLATVMALQPRSYNLIDQTDKPQIGFIAQEVLEVVPEVVESVYNSVTEEDRYTLSYGNLTAVLTKAIQEQQALINNLTERLTALEGAQA